MLNFIVQSGSSSYTKKVVVSIFPQVAMTLTSNVFGTLEGNGNGLKFSSALTNVMDYSYLAGIIMLIVSGTFFLLLGLYLD